MTRTQALSRLGLLAVLAWFAGAPAQAARTDIHTQADPAFSFAGLKTWAWHPDGPGDVRQAISADTDPKAIAAQIDPIVIPTLERALAGRGFTKTAAVPDLYVHYYFLATVAQGSQFMGQFVAPVPEWGLPPFAPSTTSLEVYPLGTLIVDITSPARGALVWRGSAERRIDVTRPYKKRRQILERAITDLLKRFPPPPSKQGS